MSGPHVQPGSERPLVAFVVNVLTPYRAHVHRRIAREAPEIRLATLLTHDQPDQPWERRDDPEINAVRFGEGQPVSEQASPRRLVADWVKGGRMIRWLREQRAAAVVVAGYNDITRARLIRHSHARGIPCFLTADSNARGDRATGLRRVLKGAVVRAVVRRCAGIMPCGTLGRDYFLRYGADPGRIFLHPYEPDYELFANPPPHELRAVCSRLRLEPARRRLVVSARLVRDKRVDVALRAFASIADARPDWDLVIIGQGPLRMELAALVPARLSPRVVFTGFLGEPATIAALYRASSVLVCPSEWEPWGVVINEAVAAGMAVVATSVVGAAADLVRDGVNGRIVPPGETEPLAAALLDATARSEDMGAASAGVLADWRRRADPIEGLRQALASIRLVAGPR